MQIIICDSREQKNGHILAYFKRCGIPFIIQKMDVADYQLQGVDDLVIDRKQNLEELSKNLTNRSDSSRFWREIRRAHSKKIKLIILVEHGENIRCIEDVKNWASRFSGVDGRDLMQQIYRCHISYGVDFLFCDKSETPQKIIRILSGECLNGKRNFI